MTTSEGYITVIEHIDSLLISGSRFMKSPDSRDYLTSTSSSELSLPTSIKKKEWIDRSIKYLLDILPNAIITEEYPDIVQIHKSLKENGHIIANVNINKQIDIIGSALFDIKEFIQWLSSFDDNGLNSKQKANLAYAPLEAMLSFVQKTIFPLLVGKEDGRTSKTAILHLFGRLFALIQSVVHLNRVPDCYILIASLRMLLELYVDMLLFQHNCIENCIEKFFCHHELYKSRTVVNLLRIDAEVDKSSDSSVLVDNQIDPEEIRKKNQKLWHCDKCPNHWSKETLEQRARLTNSLEIYRHVYYAGNMFVHSGYIELLSEEENAHLLCSHAYGIGSDMLKKATRVACEAEQISHLDDVLMEMSQMYSLCGYFGLWKDLSRA